MQMLVNVKKHKLQLNMKDHATENSRFNGFLYQSLNLQVDLHGTNHIHKEMINIIGEKSEKL